MNTTEMNNFEEILCALERLPASEREKVAEWFRDLDDGIGVIREPAAAYVTAREQHGLSVDEYLKLEEQSAIKHEYIAGEMFAMSGTSVPHNTIAGNLFAAFHAHLRGAPCRAFIADVKARLKIDRNEIFYYPDVMVACGPLNREEPWLRNPKLIVEVLSPSTEKIDRREKALNYRQIVTLEEYVLVAQKAREVTIQRRSEEWKPVVLTSFDAVAEFKSIELSLPLKRIYEGAW